MAEDNDKSASGGRDGEENVTLEQYLAMSEEDRAKLPKARQKKLAKQAEVQKRKAAKGAVQAQAQNSTNSGQSGKASGEKRQKKKGVEITEDDLRDDTPKGEKKIMKKMLPAYHPKYVESSWYEWWEAKNFFRADEKKAQDVSDEDKFVMVIPPPNVTGSLHLGHALMATLEDVITRWHRMHGRVTLYLPGVDHAGIATQVVVEKKLAKEQNLTRHDLGRENFVKEVWKWKDEYGGKITGQLRRIGTSCDWSREEFTFSEKLSRAVKEAFVQLYDRKLIYRDTRLVNWCCKLRTALSDIEVEYVDIGGRTLREVPGHKEPVEFGVLTQFSYKVEASDEELVIATTRLETMLGDVAVAVHPEDKRYQHLIGNNLIHPFVDRKLKIIADGELVDMEFGTGAVKVTPAHDPNDFACGRRNQLDEINILTDDGLMNESCGKFAGMTRYEARVALEKALEEVGQLRGKVDNAMRLGVCSRTGDVIEPLLKPQWWVDCKEMARRSADAVRNGELSIVPNIFESTWYYWLDNIRDWCVSRQLWWGHRVPAYLAQANGKADAWIVGRDEEEARKRASELLGVDPAEISLHQDEDVLDTWFSSGLFPFSVFGWPDETDDFKAFFPTTLLETGHDILFFWVARMVMMSLALTDKLPFKTVFLHAMVRDKHGRKMSKSLGNVIDPLEVIDGRTIDQLLDKLNSSSVDPREKERASEAMKLDFANGIPECGSDALRCGLVAYTQQARDINLDVQRVVGYRNFCNKLWNATRFALGNLGEDFVFQEECLLKAVERADPMDLYILHCLTRATADTEEAFQTYSFYNAVTSTYNFWLYELCDVYLEAIKPVVGGSDAEAKSAALHVLYHCLHSGLRLLHPIMPYVTEELFQRLPNRSKSDPTESICISPFPDAGKSKTFPDMYRMICGALDAVKAIRSLRAEYNLKPSERPKVYLLCRSDDSYNDTLAISPKITTLSQSALVDVVRYGQGEVPAGCGVKVVSEFVEVHLLLLGLVDLKAELAKLESTAEQKKVVIDSYKRKEESVDYESRVPENVRMKNKEALEKYSQELATIEDLRVRFEDILRQAGSE
eukprot:CAMPEP_0198731364 /NCGR_PEP_ID=MMETSP1475-20131203/29311_1 /TAXON_ID= ORGANISM="Unidentified sp., Strain CCMP1999" /NCGR_SAMPLE_ID=MMETSP1475 /ASSEMBLY_ACC=CAM_ASM_001111 /LENGTH=1074 /DNA_ID=CAMNT_0044494321 /DNA_START=42 /DNA_END=3266 /DNA_ORIENTATION=-